MIYLLKQMTLKPELILLKRELENLNGLTDWHDENYDRKEVKMWYKSCDLVPYKKVGSCVCVCYEWMMIKLLKDAKYPCAELNW